MTICVWYGNGYGMVVYGINITYRYGRTIFDHNRALLLKSCSHFDCAVLTEQEIAGLAKRLDGKWKTALLMLGLSESEVYAVECDNGGRTFDAIFAGIWKWRNNCCSHMDESQMLLQLKETFQKTQMTTASQYLDQWTGKLKSNKTTYTRRVARLQEINL